MLKWGLVNFDRSDTFLFGVSSNLSQQKSPTAEIFRHIFSRNNHSEKICLSFLLLGSFVAMNLKKPKTRKCPIMHGLSSAGLPENPVKQNRVASNDHSGKLGKKTA